MKGLFFGSSAKTAVSRTRTPEGESSARDGEIAAGRGYQGTQIQSLQSGSRR